MTSGPFASTVGFCWTIKNGNIIGRLSLVSKVFVILWLGTNSTSTITITANLNSPFYSLVVFLKEGLTIAASRWDHLHQTDVGFRRCLKKKLLNQRRWVSFLTWWSWVKDFLDHSSDNGLPNIRRSMWKFWLLTYRLGLFSSVPTSSVEKWLCPPGKLSRKLDPASATGQRSCKNLKIYSVNVLSIKNWSRWLQRNGLVLCAPSTSWANNFGDWFQKGRFPNIELSLDFAALLEWRICSFSWRLCSILADRLWFTSGWTFIWYYFADSGSSQIELISKQEL